MDSPSHLSLARVREYGPEMQRIEPRLWISVVGVTVSTLAVALAIAATSWHGGTGRRAPSPTAMHR